MVDSVKWFVWIFGAAMVPSPQIILGDKSGPFLNEYGRSHFISKTRIENNHYGLDINGLLSNDIYKLDGANNDTAKPQDIGGASPTA